MKIALVCTEKLPVPPVAGGAVQQYIEGIVHYLSEKHDITVFCIAHPLLRNIEIRDKVKYVRVSAESKSEYIERVKRALDPSFDLIHVYNRPMFVYELMSAFPKTKFSLSIHNEMFHSKKIPPQIAIEVIKKVEFICTVSKFIADGIEDLFPIARDMLKVIYSGAEYTDYYPPWTSEGLLIKEILKRRFGLKDYKVILNVSRLSPKKGNDVLLRAVGRLMGSRDHIALAVIGSKWYGENEADAFTKSIEELAKGLKGPVIFTGFIPPSKIPYYYTLGDIFVCPSQWAEPLARVHYEAMAAGLPIITTNRGGNAEVVAGYGNGIVIDDYKNPNAFAKSIAYLLDNPHKALQMGKVGRQLAIEKYNYKRVAQDLLKCFDAIK